MVEAHRVTRLLDDALDVLDIEDRPALVGPDDYWPAVRDFAQHYMTAWSSGQWTSSDGAARITSRQAGSDD